MDGKVRFGPFPPRDIEGISRILNDLGVEFKILESSEELAKAENDWHQSPVTYANRNKAFDPAFIYFEVSDNAYEIIGNSLESFGVLFTPFIPELEGQDFVCPKCGHTEPLAGRCPRHGVELLEFSQYARIQSERFKLRLRIMTLLMGLVTGAFYVWRWFTHKEF